MSMVVTGIYKFFSLIASLKTYSTDYFRKQQNETGYFCVMTTPNNGKRLENQPRNKEVRSLFLLDLKCWFNV